MPNQKSINLEQDHMHIEIPQIKNNSADILQLHL